MRIVGGRWRGRSLATPKSDAIRPTSDRLRESLFNVLQHGYDDSIEGARVLDLFAGTGALGLEALSRGAAFALFVDEGSEARSLIRQNVETFGAGGVDPVVSSRRDTHGASRAQRAFLAGVLRSALWQRPGSEGTCSLCRRRLAVTRRIGGGGRSAERERHSAGGIFRARAAGIWRHPGGAGKVSITSEPLHRRPIALVANHEKHAPTTNASKEKSKLPPPTTTIRKTNPASPIKTRRPPTKRMD